MEQTAKPNHSPHTARLLSIIPGFGQLYNRQLIKGLLFLVVGALFIYEMYTYGISAFAGLISLGSVAGEDHSLFLMIQGTIQILVTIIFVFFYVFNIYDAGKVAKSRKLGLKDNQTISELLNNVYLNGFPYLLIVPAYLFMIFAIVFPVLVTIFMAFMDYDFMTTPPFNLISWVGMENFADIFFLSTFREAFFSVLSWTIIWTACATTLQIVLGVLTAVVANQKFIKGKRIFGVIFLLPWAVPAFITIMTFSNMFNDSIGAINTQVIPFINNLPFEIGRAHV